MELNPRQEEVLRRATEFFGAISDEGTESTPLAQELETTDSTEANTAA